MKFIPQSIPGPVLVEPKVFGDSRGFFFEAFREDLFLKNGIPDRFIQDNQSLSVRGVLRGLHYQIEPKAQAKLVRCVRGEIFDVAVDIRPGSKTFGRYTSCILSSTNRGMLYVPKGFAHGFLTLEDNTEVLYKVSDLYSPEHERGVLWSDPEIAIAWPDLGGMDVLVSEKDQKLPLLAKAAL